MSHTFLLKPGHFEGQGMITFSMAEDELPFKSTWHILPEDEEKILFSQKVIVEGVPDQMQNSFCMRERTKESFVIDLENHLVGQVTGKGIITSERIAWEFHNTGQEFEGFEIYEKIDETHYKMRGEFSAGEGLRTYIIGELRAI